MVPQVQPAAWGKHMAQALQYGKPAIIRVPRRPCPAHWQCPAVDSRPMSQSFFHSFRSGAPESRTDKRLAQNYSKPLSGAILAGALALALGAGGAGAVQAQELASSAAADTRLPASVESALARAKLPREAVSLLVMEVDGKSAPRLSWRTHTPMNPASVLKLVTTYAALDQLGPAYVWRTPVLFGGPVEDGALRGNLYIQGQGDPKLVVERLWLMLRRLQGMGVKVIVGDIVLDRGAFQNPGHNAASFDNEPWRPYNVSPDALLINYKAVAMGFSPDSAAGVARVQYDPPMHGMQNQATVPLAPAGSDCGDWQSKLKLDMNDPQRIGFQGQFPATCGEKSWAVAPGAPEQFAGKAIEGMWRELGGKLTGTVRDGKVPAGLTPVFQLDSPSLAEVVRDVNKYSNNVMAQHVFLTLGMQRTGTTSFDASRTALSQWWQSKWGSAELPVVDNGAGLSRDARITANALGQMLQQAWRSPVMPEFIASMPIVGVDGTLRRSRSSFAGAAHLKTGTLRDSSALAGYVNGVSGRRYVLVAMANHNNAVAARAAWDALVDWTARDQ